MGFLSERFSKSIENNNHNRNIYRNDNIAMLVRHNNSDNAEEMLDHTSLSDFQCFVRFNGVRN